MLANNAAIFIAITSCLFENRKAFNNPNTASLIKTYDLTLTQKNPPFKIRTHRLKFNNN